ncbi:unnamed protein product [Medioppia subpectinata]|uniref:Dol-P-Glc:Glc(2)Man(9)GlcNAc(2)-PP-Dol alpha-1,2-glucosyltransferase n=1 Tax=Medioppia subpectinata TaxID=1979941 RepID=A0A7R9L2G1_9ACAR|nr:unnamed protein product [Medioppia subpectinata]CAG2114312.1 unnamed protein product [Medioppia subpectinata]
MAQTFVERQNGFIGGKTSAEVMFNKIVILIGTAFGFAILAVMILVNDHLPEPYMDEIFHVQQTQTYCKGNFTYLLSSHPNAMMSCLSPPIDDKLWNPKITTPPGLYLTTLGFLKPFSELYAFGEDDEKKICPLFILRLMNVIFTCANSYLIYLISVQIHQIPRTSKLMLLFSSVSLATLPPLFFFSFLYYTDPGSLFFVLLMYMFDVNELQPLAAIFGAISLLYRQTNIVWVFFLAAHTSLKLTIDAFSEQILNKNPERQKRRVLMKSLIQALPQIIIVCGGYALVGIIFIAFLVYNNGIVLGDRLAHEAVLHLAQIPYYLGFVSFFAFPWIFTANNIKKFMSISVRYPLRVLSGVAVMVVVLYRFAYTHPYLLADNRHYTFYIWKRILGREGSALTYAVTPVYVFTAVTMYQLLQRKDSNFKTLLILCTFVSVVPQKLLELRYFLVPFVIWRMNIVPTNTTVLSLELALYTIVNTFTIYMFVFKTFKWPQNNELQRIMW